MLRRHVLVWGIFTGLCVFSFFFFFLQTYSRSHLVGVRICLIRHSSKAPRPERPPGAVGGLRSLSTIFDLFWAWPSWRFSMEPGARPGHRSGEWEARIGGQPSTLQVHLSLTGINKLFGIQTASGVSAQPYIYMPMVMVLPQYSIVTMQLNTYALCTCKFASDI